MSPESQAILDRIEDTVGSSPNLFLTAARSSAALASLWSQMDAAGDMGLSADVQQAIALRISQINGCSYSLAALSVGVDPDQALDYRRGRSSDPKEQAILDLVTKVVQDRGHHAGFEVEVARREGVSDEEILEAVALIGLNTYRNYIDCVANAEVDYPCPEDIRS